MLVESMISQLKDTAAQHYFKIAEYYEHKKKFKSALIYYNDVVDKYEETTWGMKAFEKVQVLKKTMGSK